MQDISRRQVQRLVSSDTALLVEVLPATNYREGHIPGAVSIPLDAEFDRRVQTAVPDKNTPVIVYCANTDCPLAPRAAEHLDHLGYNKVFDYRGGKADWEGAGLRMEVKGAAR
jgi:rhodanese-related sulfurtransferase